MSNIHEITAEDLNREMSSYDLKRLESYGNNLLDHHVVMDLVPQLAHWYFVGRFRAEMLASVVQRAVLLGIGLQKKSVEQISVCIVRTRMIKCFYRKN